MRIRYTPRAFADREAIFAYLDQRNPRAARDVKATSKNPSPTSAAFRDARPWFPAWTYTPYGLDGTRISSTTGSAGRKSPSSISDTPPGGLGPATNSGSTKRLVGLPEFAGKSRWLIAP